MYEGNSKFDIKKWLPGNKPSSHLKSRFAVLPLYHFNFSWRKLVLTFGVRNVDRFRIFVPNLRIHVLGFFSLYNLALVPSSEDFDLYFVLVAHCSAL